MELSCDLGPHSADNGEEDGRRGDAHQQSKGAGKLGVSRRVGKLKAKSSEATTARPSRSPQAQREAVGA